MCPALQTELSKQQIQFRFNPPSSSHFGGVWQREFRSIKSLYTTLQGQSMTEEGLNTVLTEIEGIMNSKPLGYVSTDIAYPYLLTLNLLLMAWQGSSHPQTIYYETDLLSCCRRRHSQVLAAQYWTQFTKCTTTCPTYILMINGRGITTKCNQT